MCFRDYGPDALEQAKKNVENHYLFVGLTEDFENTLKMLEVLVPQQFKGAANTSWRKSMLIEM